MKNKSQNVSHEELVIWTNEILKEERNDKFTGRKKQKQEEVKNEIKNILYTE